MTNEGVTYPEYDAAGERNPIRLPITEASEQWEKDLIDDISPVEFWDLRAGRRRHLMGD